jgi:hypothetical protein
MKKVVGFIAAAAAMPAAAAVVAGAPTVAQAARADGAAAGASSMNDEHGVKGKQVQLDQGRLAATHSRWASIDYAPVKYYIRTGGTASIGYGTSVYVTCYYSGAPYHDPYWDHATELYEVGTGVVVESGHVADSFVNLGGKVPPKAGIPHCG